MKKLILLSLAFISTSSFGQQLPSVIPQSPEAAALSKYSEFPVGTFTGIPGISIPLYTIQCGDISIPLALSYHAGGFRVNEEASCVGLGWNLNISAAITRSIVGEDDFAGGNSRTAYFSTATPRLLDIISANGFNGYNRLGAYSEKRPYESVVVDGQSVDYRSYVNYFDWEPDIYSVNCFDHNGKFVFDQDTNLYFLEKQDMVIEKTSSGWIARTNDGFKYYFEAESKTYNDFRQEINSSWFLTKIVSPNHREALFYYTTGAWIMDLSYSESSEKTESDVNQYYLVQPRFSGAHHEEKYLDSILFDDGTRILFTRGSRSDIKDGEKLKSFRIYNMNNTLIREFELRTNYFEADNQIYGYFKNIPLIDYSYMLQRLRLDTIIEKNGTEIKKHVFQYSSVKLPNKDSFAQDYWGYYNGAFQNNKLIPNFEGTLFYDQLTKKEITYYNGASLTELTSTGNKNEYKQYYGADKEPNGNYMEACILKKIIYPTGGYTEFEFEANDYRNVSNEGTYEYAVFSQNIKRTGFNNAPDTYYQSCPIPFSYPATAVDIFDERFEIFVEHFGSGTPDYQFDVITIDANTTDTDNPFFHKTFYIKELANGNSTFSCTENIELHNATNRFHLIGPITMDINMPETNDTKSITLTFSAKVKKPITKTKEYAGGLRIKKITQCEGSDPSKNIVKTYKYEYDYRKSDGTTETLSSGILKTPVRTHSLKFVIPSMNYTSAWSSRLFSSSNNYALTQTQSNHIGYSKITEFIGPNGELGRTEYVYKNEPNEIFEHYLRPIGVPVSVQAVNDGKLISKTEFNYYNQKVSRIANSYELLDEDIIKGINQDGWVYTFGEATINADKMHICGVGNGCLHYYPIFSRWEALTETSERQFYGNDSIVNITHYFYNTSNLLPSTIVTTNSNGDVIKKRQFYPQEITGKNFFTASPFSDPEYNAINNLKKIKDDGAFGLYRTSTVIQTNEYNNDVLTSIQRNNYGLFNTLVMPANIQTSILNNPLETKIIYHDYDAHGNILQVSRNSDINICYLWGYNYSYPVAKIENASISQVRTILNGIPVLSGPLSTTHINQLKAGIQNALISTYTFKPLVGLTSQTDPNGITTFYEYNGMGQLTFIKNADGNILKTCDYHYKQQ
jgi:YD repeat-containing protein